MEEKPANDDLEDESYEMEMEHEPVADRMKVKEAKKKKLKKQKVRRRIRSSYEMKVLCFRMMNSSKNHHPSILIKFFPI